MQKKNRTMLRDTAEEAQMAIQVSFMGVLASVTSEKQRHMRAEAGITLRQLLERLEAHYGEDFGRRVFRAQTSPRPLQTHTRIFVNGRMITTVELDRALEEGPEVLIYVLPASTGG